MNTDSTVDNDATEHYQITAKVPDRWTWHEDATSRSRVVHVVTQMLAAIDASGGVGDVDVIEAGGFRVWFACSGPGLWTSGLHRW
jgi:hypothetical protein